MENTVPLENNPKINSEILNKINVNKIYYHKMNHPDEQMKKDTCKYLFSIEENHKFLEHENVFKKKRELQKIVHQQIRKYTREKNIYVVYMIYNCLFERIEVKNIKVKNIEVKNIKVKNIKVKNIEVKNIKVKNIKVKNIEVKNIKTKNADYKYNNQISKVDIICPYKKRRRSSYYIYCRTKKYSFPRIVNVFSSVVRMCQKKEENHIHSKKKNKYKYIHAVNLKHFINHKVVKNHQNDIPKNMNVLLFDEEHSNTLKKDFEIISKRDKKYIHQIAYHESTKPDYINMNELPINYDIQNKMIIKNVTGEFTLEEHEKKKCDSCYYCFSNECNLTYCKYRHHDEHDDYINDMYKNKINRFNSSESFFNRTNNYSVTKTSGKAYEEAFPKNEEHNKNVFMSNNWDKIYNNNNNNNNNINTNKKKKIKKIKKNTNNNEEGDDVESICTNHNVLNNIPYSIDKHHINTSLNINKNDDLQENILIQNQNYFPKMFQYEINESERYLTFQTSRSISPEQVEDQQNDIIDKIKYSSIEKKNTKNDPLLLYLQTNFMKKEEENLLTNEENNTKENICDEDNKNKKRNDNKNLEGNMNNQTDKQMDNQKSDHITGQMQDIIEEDHKKSIMIHENVTKKINDFPNNKSCEENNSPKHITNVKKSILIKNTKKRDGQVFYHKHIYEKNKGHLYNLRNEKINDTPIIEKNKNKKIDSDNESLILIKHNKGSCNPCANYFFHFSGCSKGNQCTKCHHDYHKNHEDPLHPSQLLHKKNICVPCENYFKKQCKRSMPVCIYCHDDSHKKEYTAAGKINELTNDKNQILYVKTHLYINQQEHVREIVSIATIMII
ncbi:hypothetical protein PFUGPA_04611 [Plasmodium falciparum Palo Alto/Uganda]|uniref:Uncharacterized protein n=2 Tax=Plasmodium falciparum TaxID=5833 RepID=W4IU39_PLAFP|nr:hypothetical protein PFUGPA_04611 [Plasmodium falciparum Palo Alto/Uganda]